MSKIEFEDRGRSLEEQFFRKEQAKQVEAMRAKKERAEAIAALSTATGVRDATALDNLVELGVDAASLTAFSLAPLAHVAWADGTMDDKERSAILKAAADLGIAEGSSASSFLQDLLAAPPAGALMDTWERFVESLREETTPETFAALAGKVVGQTRQVAEAAGGILGIGSVSRAEAEAIARVEAALA